MQEDNALLLRLLNLNNAELSPLIDLYCYFLFQIHCLTHFWLQVPPKEAPSSSLFLYGLGYTTLFLESKLCTPWEHSQLLLPSELFILDAFLYVPVFLSQNI